MSSKLERHAEQLAALGHPVRLAAVRFVVMEKQTTSAGCRVPKTEDEAAPKSKSGCCG
jgi:hypothetical protein